MFVSALLFWRTVGPCEMDVDGDENMVVADGPRDETRNHADAARDNSGERANNHNGAYHHPHPTRPQGAWGEGAGG